MFEPAPWRPCMPEKRLFLYGGSFNPPHMAHVLAIACLRTLFPLSPIWVAPTLRHAFDKTLKPYNVRRAMLVEALRGIRNITVSDIEKELNLPKSRTINVVEKILQDFPDVVPTVVIGADILPELSSWRQFDKLAELSDFFVFPRPGYEYVSPFGVPILADVSSTQIRDAIANNHIDQCRGLLPPGVIELWLSSDE